MDLTIWLKCNRQIPSLFFIDKDSDVRSNRILLRYDAKSNAGIAMIQRYQRIGERRAIDLHVTLLCGVGS